MSLKYNHCLRPRFTKNILTSLLKGTSVNVVVPKIGQEDKEADRLMEDIQNGTLPNTRVLAVNMRFCRGSYQQFLLDLWHQYHQQPAQESPDLFNILAGLEQAQQQFIIVLNHLDTMCAKDVDVRFDQDFYIRLNSLKNYRHVALLVITQGTSYHGMEFNIGGEFKTSRLDIQEIEYLPALTREEAQQELERRQLKLTGVHISHILQQVRLQETYDYALLDYLARQIQNTPKSWQDIPKFMQQLSVWQKQYQSQHQQVGYRAQKTVDTADKYINIFRVKHIFKTLYQVLKMILIDPIVVLIEKFFAYLHDKRTPKK